MGAKHDVEVVTVEDARVTVRLDGAGDLQLDLGKIDPGGLATLAAAAVGRDVPGLLAHADLCLSLRLDDPARTSLDAALSSDFSLRNRVNARIEYISLRP